MVDSILANSTAPQLQPIQNRSVTSTAVSDASIIPEVELADTVIDITPRSMDTDAESSFSSRGAPDMQQPLGGLIRDDAELRPSLENFSPIEITSEQALENRIADIEIRTNNDIDETDTQVSVNNSAIEAFTNTDVNIQQSVDLTA